MAEQLRAMGMVNGMGNQSHTTPVVPSNTQARTKPVSRISSKPTNKQVMLYNRRLVLASIYAEEKDLIFIKEENEERMVIALHIRHHLSMSDIGKLCRNIYNLNVQDVVVYLEQQGVQCLGCTNLNHTIWKENKRKSK